MKIRRVLPFAATPLLLGLFVGAFTTPKNENVVKATYNFGDAATYYNEIDNSLTGNSLLKALNTLNKSKRQSTIGYNSLKNYYQYTDYDPKYATTDINGVTSGERLLSFYSGTSATYSGGNMNKEHVWPDSRGGNKVEADIHMPRPTIQAENGSRGNSFYVEGMKHTSNGWDPAMESFGDETYRGDSARIIFYSAIADTSLGLVDKTNDSTSNNTMGKLSDMIKWHLNYPVMQREKNRNEGAEYLQGNRNPFIDHPEYVCRIWGNTNDTTRSLCANDPYALEAPTEIVLSETPETIMLEQTITISVKSVVPSNASKLVYWSSSNEKVVTISDSGLITAVGVGTATITATSTGDKNIKATRVITVVEPDPVELLDLVVDPEEIELFVGKTMQISTILDPIYVYPKATISYSSNNKSIATVSDSGLVKGVASGTTEIVVTAKQGEKTITKNIPVTISIDANAPQYELVKSNSDLSTGDSVVLATSLLDDALGVTGFDNTKDATISGNKELWMKYEVTITTNGFTLYDATAEQYIATPTSNQFIYGTEGGVCSVDSDGRIMCNNRYLEKNTTYIRFYQQLSYIPFYTYKCSVSAPAVPELIKIELSDYTTTVELGETYQFDGVVTAFYSDDSSKEVLDYSISGVSTDETGEVLVTISYTENDITKTASFNLEVLEPELVDPTLIEIQIAGQTTEIEVGETYQFDGTVIATYSDGNSKEVTNFNVSVVSTEIPGTVVVTISYTEGEATKTVSFTLVVKESETPVIPDNPPTTKLGCGGSILTTSILLSSLSILGAGVILVKKRRK